MKLRPETSGNRYLDRGEWKKLVSRKEEFTNIVSVLNQFYVARTPYSQFSNSQKLRIQLEKEGFKNFEAFLKKLGEHDFLIYLRTEGKYESWIHIDGIQEERDRFLNEGTKDHPVFDIVCVSDLFEKDCVFAEEEETKTFSK
ncbi:LIC_13246 family protein [Leptospira stimsonii]|uniref:Uncharacterized protein n=1 Tax=Leptospira stimsonii TaxID=2202203 RepID=A0ABY2NB34_9LEPT|nr:hypothetical protein [Leptospira stimsonii]TGK10899.1 hypothetical protein EHO98_20245 [Leptospira stimsonii]TGM20283.1 hypothetical protein EHQ90_02970 [Leptospira stimsonii]